MISISLGVKHRKVLHKLEKSSDPEDALKLKKALEQAAKAKSIETLTDESKSTSISSKSIQPTLVSTTPYYYAIAVEYLRKFTNFFSISYLYFTFRCLLMKSSE